jgi:photosystem II stability/assembly factor-like uncharacterized protein
MSDKAVRSLQSSDLKRLDWRSVGPAIMGGRVACLAFEPGNAKRFYVGFAAGGLWVTDNHGTTLKPIFDDQETASIGSIAITHAPADWKGWTAEEKKEGKKKLAEMGQGRILWVGTGEGNGRNSSSWGHGVYRSTDKGKTWQHCGLEDSHDIPAIAAHPKDPDTCWAACAGHLWGPNETRGVYKTTNGGKKWKRVLSADDLTGAIDLKIDPNNPDILFAALCRRERKAHSFFCGGESGGIFKSTDGGETWTKLTEGLPKSVGRIGLDIFRGDSSKIIACVQSDEGGTADIRDDRSRAGGVFRSDDGGATWTRLSQRTPRPFYFSTICFDPKDDQRVYQSGWYVEVSDDGGRTFRADMGVKLHVDMHALIVNPEDPDHLVNGSDGGVYVSFDRGAKWSFLNTIAVGQFYNISLDDSDPYRIIGGLQDNGTWVWPSSGIRESGKEEDGTLNTGLTNGDVQYVNWGDGFHADFDPTDKDVVYAEWQGGNLTRMNMRTGKRELLAPKAAEGQAAFRFNWNSPFFVSPHNPNVIYLGGSVIFRMTERGEKWEVISPDLTTNDTAKMGRSGSSAENHCTVVSLAESPLVEGLLWAGSDDGLVHVRLGGEWKNVTPKAAAGRYVSRIEASPHDAATAFMSLDGHRSDDYRPCILMTTDSGATWKDITANLPDKWSVHVVRQDLGNPNCLYCGTEQALWVSLDMGGSWTKMHGKKLPTVPVFDIKQHPRTRDLVIATHGRSVWVLDDGFVWQEMTPSTMGKGLHLFAPRPAQPRWMQWYNGLWSDQIFRAANRPNGALICYWVGEYTGDDVSISIKNGQGLEVAELKGSNAPGLNRVVWDLQPKEAQRLPDNGQEPWLDFFVPAGEYEVTVKMGDLEEKGALMVLPMPE